MEETARVEESKRLLQIKRDIEDLEIKTEETEHVQVKQKQIDDRKKSLEDKTRFVAEQRRIEDEDLKVELTILEAKYIDGSKDELAVKKGELQERKKKGGTTEAKRRLRSEGSK